MERDTSWSRICQMLASRKQTHLTADMGTLPHWPCVLSLCYILGWLVICGPGVTRCESPSDEWKTVYFLVFCILSPPLSLYTQSNSNHMIWSQGLDLLLFFRRPLITMFLYMSFLISTSYFMIEENALPRDDQLLKEKCNEYASILVLCILNPIIYWIRSTLLSDELMKVLDRPETLPLIFDPQNGSKRYRREWASCCLGWIWIPIWVTVIWYESFKRTTFNIQSWIRQRLRLEWHPHHSRFQDRMRLPFGATLSAGDHPRTFLPNTHTSLCTHLGHKSSPILGRIDNAFNLQISNQNCTRLYLWVCQQTISRFLLRKTRGQTPEYIKWVRW